MLFFLLCLCFFFAVVFSCELTLLPVPRELVLRDSSLSDELLFEDALLLELTSCSSSLLDFSSTVLKLSCLIVGFLCIISSSFGLTKVYLLRGLRRYGYLSSSLSFKLSIIISFVPRLFSSLRDFTENLWSPKLRGSDLYKS